MRVINSIASRDLGEAIVEQAAYDYLDLKKDLHRIEIGTFYRKVKNIELTKRKLKTELKDVIKFFGSDWYYQLTPLGHSVLISKLDEKFEEWKKGLKTNLD